MSYPRLTKSLTASLLCLALALGACSQSTTPRMSDQINIQLTNIAAQVALVTLEVGGQSYTATLNGNGSASVTLPNLPVGNTLFVARGLDQADGGIVLYKTSKTVAITAGSNSVDISLARLSDNIAVSLSGAGGDLNLAADEVLVAQVGAVKQRLLGGANPQGVISSVATGRGLTVLVNGSVNGVVTHQGLSTIDHNEGGSQTTVALQALNPNIPAPSQPILSGANTVLINEPYALTVAVAEPVDVLVNWGDGSQPVSSTVSGSQTFTHTYSATSFNTITVIASNDGGFTPATKQVQVTNPASGNNPVDVVIDGGAELITVQVIANNAPAGAQRVQALITSAVKTHTIELIPQGGSWDGSLDLTLGANYSLVLKAITGASETSSSSMNFTASAASTPVTHAFETSGGGTPGPNTPPKANNGFVAVLGSKQTVLDFATMPTCLNPNTPEICNEPLISDADGDPLTITNFAMSAQFGTITQTGPLTLSINPVNMSASAPLTYTVIDGKGGTASGTLTVVISFDANVGF